MNAGTTRAPERVWLKPCQPMTYSDDYYVCVDEPKNSTGTEYTRSDLAQAAIAAVVEQAAMRAQMNQCYECSHHGPSFMSPFHDHKLSNAIRALASQSASDALVAAIEAAKREERERWAAWHDSEAEKYHAQAGQRAGDDDEVMAQVYQDRSLVHEQSAAAIRAQGGKSDE